MTFVPLNADNFEGMGSLDLSDDTLSIPAPHRLKVIDRSKEMLMRSIIGAHELEQEEAYVQGVCDALKNACSSSLQGGNDVTVGCSATHRVEEVRKPEVEDLLIEEDPHWSWAEHIDRLLSEGASSPPPIVENIARTREPFIIVVRTPYLGDYWFKSKALESLRWISNTFPVEQYPNRRLVLIHNGWLWYVKAKIGDILQDWECYAKWQDVYVKLLSSGFPSLDPIKKPMPVRWFDVFSCSQQFAFAAYINLRNNRDEAGFGYGLSERYEDRCPLRALLLAARGKTVCLDWGHPGDLGSNYRGCGSVAGVADMLDHDVYEFCGTRMRRQGENWTMFGLPHGHHAQQPFARAIRNGHYLGSFSSALDELPLDVVEQLIAGIDGNLFTDAQARYGHWIGWWELFFAEDYRSIRYHQWQAVRDLQGIVISRYILAHQNWASSTCFEVAVDCVTLLGAGLFYAALDAEFSGSTPSTSFVLLFAPMTVVLWAIVWDIWAHYNVRRLLLSAHEDRASHLVFVIDFFRAALFAPVLNRPLLILAYRYFRRRLLSFETRWWYEGIRLHEPLTATRVEAVYIAVLMVVSGAMPWTSSTWGDTLGWILGIYSCRSI